MPQPDPALVPVLTILIDPADSALLTWPTTDGRLVSVHLPAYLGRGLSVLAQVLAEDRKEGINPLIQGYRKNAEVARLASRMSGGVPVDAAAQGSYFAQIKRRLVAAAADLEPAAELAPLYERTRGLGTRLARDDYRVVWHGRVALG
jgi:hypothetical protein